MLFNTVKTIYSIALETCVALGVDYNPLPKSMINGKYDINPTVVSGYPKLQYFGIGLRYNDLIENNTLSIENVTHAADSIDLFRPIPFLVREKDIGLTPAEFTNYRMIVERTINGTEYILCFFKKIDLGSSVGGYYDIQYDGLDYVVDDITIYSREDVPIQRVDKYPDKVGFISYSHSASITLTSTEIDNIKIGIELLYGELDGNLKANLGEIALYTGLESEVDGRPEVFNSQAAYFLNTNILLDTLVGTEAINIENVNIGGMPLKLTNLN